MNANKRPLPVTILACVYIVVGVVGMAVGFRSTNMFLFDNVMVEFVRFLAIISGVFMLRGCDWARWLALAWIVFHVILSAFYSFSECAIHCLFGALIAWFLCRPEATGYFRAARTDPT